MTDKEFELYLKFIGAYKVEAKFRQSMKDDHQKWCLMCPGNTPVYFLFFPHRSRGYRWQVKSKDRELKKYFEDKWLMAWLDQTRKITVHIR